MKRVLVIAAIPLLSIAAATAAHAQPQPPAACRSAIDARLPGWQLSPPPADLARVAKQKKISTNVVQSDFDDNGTRDTAVLVVMPGTGELHPRQRIAVCLSQAGTINLHVIGDPYCGDGISVAPKGTRAWDFTTEKPVTYWTNGVSAYCYEKAGGTYLFRDGKFILIVDSD
ncbi:MAG TPA: hypothetical protein VFO21_05830 [Vicinamibacterales bacterium]|nr:hypothetical protein [Vicinamibacterales bacterium]